MSNAVLQLIVLAGIALFLIMKLRSVMGSRDGFERPEIERPDLRAQDRRGFEVIEGGVDADIADHVKTGSAAADALARMKAVDPAFKVGEFLQGARAAYEMILTAFNKGDVAAVKPYVSEEVAAAFQQVVDARAAQGLTVTSEFLGVRDVGLEEATFNKETGEAEITVRFTGELVQAVKDATGAVVEGDAKSARKQRDTWTFERWMGSKDPNWRLVATGV